MMTPEEALSELVMIVQETGCPSNGGGQGNEWIVLPRGWTKTVSEDDI